MTAWADWTRIISTNLSNVEPQLEALLNLQRSPLSCLAEIKEYSDGVERLENKPLSQQRFVPSAEKTDNLNKLALGAKVERALGRRMTGQDAVMRKPVVAVFDEKKALEH